MRNFLPILVLVTICLVPSASNVVRAQSTVGVVEFPNSGSAEAQAPFLHGLAQLHNFEYDDAAAAFRKAQETDPSFAMAYWGEAMTHNHPIWMEQDTAAARAILKKLGATPEARLAKASTEREKDYLRAVEVIYGEGDKKGRDFAYSDAMEKLSQKYADDVNAAAFYALSLLGTAHKGRDFAIYMRSAAVLEQAFRDHPNHPGIVHYLIHSYDDPIHAPLGLRAARIYSRLAPAAAHAQHMTSHIYVALGMWDDVVPANENATSVVNRDRTAQGKLPRYGGHYNFWLEYGYLQQGRYEAAKSLLKKSYESIKQSEASSRHMHGMDALDPDNSPFASFIQMRLRYLVDSGDWNGEVASWEVPTQQNLGARITEEFTRGFGAIQRGNGSEARTALEKLKEAKQELEISLQKQVSSDQSYGVRASILEEQLQAMIWLSEGMKNQAVSQLQATAKKEETMPIAFGPPFVDKPTYELLGEMLLKTNRPEEARAAFETALTRTPLRTASLLGLASAVDKSGDKQKAGETYGILRQIWRQADQTVRGSLPHEK